MGQHEATPAGTPASSLGVETGQYLWVLTLSARSLLFRGILGNSTSKLKLVIHYTWVWCASIADNLRQQDAKGPDVRFNGERAVVDGLRGCPFDGEFGSCGKLKISQDFNQH